MDPLAPRLACIECWNAANRGEPTAARLTEAADGVPPEPCVGCGRPTTAGYYVRGGLGAPRRTGKPAEETALTGKLIPWANGQPVLVQVVGAALSLPIFSSPEQLRATMAAMDVEFEGIKHIDAEDAFDDLPRDIEVIIDLRLTPDGKWRYSRALPG
jgi:hypothetical protein